MRAIDVIKMVIATSDASVIPLIEDMREHPLVQPTQAGGNHPLWVLGHLAVAEGSFYHMLTGEPHPLEHWRPLFDAGSEPVADETAYPSFEEVRNSYRELRERNLKLLDSFGDDGIAESPNAKPPTITPEYFSSVAQTFVTMAVHQSFHGGQVADSRRAAGRRPLE
jgi:hypothetical protein